jgi:Domain of unknown function (DUF4157)
MESAFAHDLDGVRIHTGRTAAKSADSMNAQAYTVGNDIVFGPDRYAPNEVEGRQLLAHELAHVIQQRKGGAGSLGTGRSASPDSFEADADRAATGVIAGQQAHIQATGTPPAIQASEKTKKKGSKKKQRETPPPDLDDPKTRGRVLERVPFDVEVKPALEKKGYVVYYKDNFPKELKEVFPDKRVRPEFVAIHETTGKIIVGDITAKPSTGAELKPGDIRKLPHGTTTEIETRPHLQKTVDYAQQLRRSGKFKDAEIVAQDWYSEDPDFKFSKEVVVQKAAKKGGTRTRVSRSKTGEVEAEGGLSTSKRSGRAQKQRTSKSRRRPRQSAVKGTVAHLGLTFGIGLLEQKFQEMMLEDLEKLPKPKIDHRAAADYFRDPQQAKSMKVIDLFNKELGAFQGELESHSTGVLWAATFETLAAGEVTDLEDRLERLGATSEELSIYQEDLAIISDNLDALLDLEKGALESAEAADDLIEIMRHPLAVDYLVRTIGVEGYSQAESALLHHAAAIRKLFGDARKLRASLDQLMKQRDEMEETIDGFRRDAFKELVRERMEEVKKEREEAQQDEPIAKPTPATKPTPAVKPKSSESLWQRGTRALRQARSLRNTPSAPESDTRAALDELYAVVGAIESKGIDGFAHEEEKDALLRLKGELLKEIGAHLDAKSRGEL